MCLLVILYDLCNAAPVSNITPHQYQNLRQTKIRVYATHFHRPACQQSVMSNGFSKHADSLDTI